MSWREILEIILVVLTITSALSWGVLFSKGRRVWQKMLELQSEYKSAVIDGTITEEEKAQIADTVIEIIGDATDIWQAMENFVREIIPLLKRPK